MIKVLREEGHIDAAREVAIAYENAKRDAGVIKGTTARSLHWLYGFAVAYGYRPMRLVWISLAVCLTWGALFWAAASAGVMAPSSPVVYENPAYAACRPENGGNWTACKSSYEYAAFSPFVYSLDLILPLVDLQQERDWAPMTTRPCEAFSFLGVCLNPQEVRSFDRPVTTHIWALGFTVWVFMWAEILFGWVASLTLVAVLSGLAKKME